jgi:hypothetical protein
VRRNILYKEGTGETIRYRVTKSKKLRNWSKVSANTYTLQHSDKTYNIVKDNAAHFLTFHKRNTVWNRDLTLCPIVPSSCLILYCVYEPTVLTFLSGSVLEPDSDIFGLTGSRFGIIFRIWIRDRIRPFWHVTGNCFFCNLTLYSFQVRHKNIFL